METESMDNVAIFLVTVRKQIFAENAEVILRF